jgi:hypothetical protein
MLIPSVWPRVPDVMCGIARAVRTGAQVATAVRAGLQSWHMRYGSFPDERPSIAGAASADPWQPRVHTVGAVASSPKYGRNCPGERQRPCGQDATVPAPRSRRGRRARDHRAARPARRPARPGPQATLARRTWSLHTSCRSVQVTSRPSCRAPPSIATCWTSRCRGCIASTTPAYTVTQVVQWHLTRIDRYNGVYGAIETEVQGRPTSSGTVSAGSSDGTDSEPPRRACVPRYSGSHDASLLGARRYGRSAPLRRRPGASGDLPDPRRGGRTVRPRGQG